MDGAGASPGRDLERAYLCRPDPVRSLDGLRDLYGAERAWQPYLPEAAETAPGEIDSQIAVVERQRAAALAALCAGGGPDRDRRVALSRVWRMGRVDPSRGGFRCARLYAGAHHRPFRLWRLAPAAAHLPADEPDALHGPAQPSPAADRVDRGGADSRSDGGPRQSEPRRTGGRDHRDRPEARRRHR